MDNVMWRRGNEEGELAGSVNNQPIQLRNEERGLP